MMFVAVVVLLFRVAHHPAGGKHNYNRWLVTSPSREAVSETAKQTGVYIT
jgi:hypothetical protein